MGLFEQLKSALAHDETGQHDPEQAKRIAAAVLMLEMAHADHVHQPSEYDEIRRQLREYFKLTADAVEDLMAAAAPEADSAVSLHGYLQTLNQGLEAGDKRQVLEMLWRVAYADRNIDADEEALLRQFAELLYLPHSEFIRAKLAVLPPNA